MYSTQKSSVAHCVGKGEKCFCVEEKNNKERKGKLCRKMKDKEGRGKWQLEIAFSQKLCSATQVTLSALPYRAALRESKKLNNTHAPQKIPNNTLLKMEN